MSVRVRFAPSPTGALHIGGVRTALFNYLFAKKNSGTFILRIEDTDQGRFVPGAEQYIQEALKWCGIEPTEGQGYGGNFVPYRQSERKDLYYQQAKILLEEGKAYYAFDTESELEHMRDRLANEGIPAPKYDATVRMNMKNGLTLSIEETQKLLAADTPFVIRLKVDPGDSIQFTDIIRGDVVFDTAELDDKVLIKADGMPTYHLANIVDDHFMEITHVIRGEEWISSAGHHILLYKAFGWDHPEFAHLPLIMRPDGKGKLSKRDGAKFGIPVFPISWNGETPEDSFEGFREYGFEPEAVINFLAFLGWNPGTDQEIFSLEELVDAFDLSKVHKSGARFDIEKARWYNQQYILNMSAEELESRMVKSKIELVSDKEKSRNIINLYKERVHFLKEMPLQADYLMHEPNTVDEAALKKHWKPGLEPKIVEFTNALSETNYVNASELEAIAKEKLKEFGLKPGEVFPIYRLALAGGLQGPTVFEMLEILGKEGFSRIIRRIEEFSNLTI